MENNLATRLKKIESLEAQLPTTAGRLMENGAPFYITSMFLLGAAQRTIDQSRAFRQLVQTENFTAAAIMLRTQVDTAMRLNGLTLLKDVEEDLKKVFSNELQFNHLRPSRSHDRKKGEKLTDAFLRHELAKQFPFINEVYKQTSDFVHLSFRPFFLGTRIGSEEERTIDFVIGPNARKYDESNYHEIADAFMHVTEMTTSILIQMIAQVHPNAPVTKEV